MRLPCILAAVTSLLAVVCSAVSQPRDAADVLLDLNQQALDALQQLEATQQKRGHSCSVASANIRSDWYAVFPSS
jgi:hypothetical protein